MNNTTESHISVQQLNNNVKSHRRTQIKSQKRSSVQFHVLLLKFSLQLWVSVSLSLFISLFCWPVSPLPLLLPLPSCLLPLCSPSSCHHLCLYFPLSRCRPPHPRYNPASLWSCVGSVLPPTLPASIPLCLQKITASSMLIRFIQAVRDHWTIYNHTCWY